MIGAFPGLQESPSWEHIAVLAFAILEYFPLSWILVE